MKYLKDMIKRTISVNGTLMAALQITEPENEVVTTSQGKRIPTQFAWVISLRFPLNGGDPYLHLSRENLAFAGLRNTVVEGLDVVSLETGETLSLQALEEKRITNIATRQAARAAARPQTVEIEIEDVVDFSTLDPDDLADIPESDLVPDPA